MRAIEFIEVLSRVHLISVDFWNLWFRPEYVGSLVYTFSSGRNVCVPMENYFWIGPLCLDHRFIVYVLMCSHSL
jgi:hypothetical protein